MRVSIGMLAHDEAGRIGDALRSLLEQSVFHQPNGLDLHHLQLVCVPNGCRDATAQIAAATFAAVSEPQHVELVVRELPVAGKGRAWNSFVHELSDPDADYLALVDADISFAERDTLEMLIRCLVDQPEVEIATDVPLKVPKTGGVPSIGDRVSRAASAQKLAHARHSICGQLYVARQDALRRIWLPNALPVEDGFLSAMVKTRGFTRPPVAETVLRVDGAHHFYEPERGFLGYLRHESRIIAGSVINSWVFERLRRAGSDGHAGAVVRDANHADPDWVEHEIADQARAGGFWLIPRHFVLWRLAPLRGQPLTRMMRRLPVALIGTAANLVACVRANAILRRKNASRHW